MAKDEMSRSFIFKGFRKTLIVEFGKATATICAPVSDSRPI